MFDLKKLFILAPNVEAGSSTSMLIKVGALFGHTFELGFSSSLAAAGFKDSLFEPRAFVSAASSATRADASLGTTLVTGF